MEPKLTTNAGVFPTWFRMVSGTFDQKTSEIIPSKSSKAGGPGWVSKRPGWWSTAPPATDHQPPHRRRRWPRRGRLPNPGWAPLLGPGWIPTIWYQYHVKSGKWKMPFTTHHMTCCQSWSIWFTYDCPKLGTYMILYICWRMLKVLKLKKCSGYWWNSRIQESSQEMIPHLQTHPPVSKRQSKYLKFLSGSISHGTLHDKMWGVVAIGLKQQTYLRK